MMVRRTDHMVWSPDRGPAGRTLGSMVPGSKACHSQLGLLAYRPWLTMLESIRGWPHQGPLLPHWDNGWTSCREYIIFSHCGIVRCHNDIQYITMWHHKMPHGPHSLADHVRVHYTSLHRQWLTRQRQLLPHTHRDTALSCVMTWVYYILLCLMYIIFSHCGIEDATMISSISQYGIIRSP